MSTLISFLKFRSIEKESGFKNPMGLTRKAFYLSRAVSRTNELRNVPKKEVSEDPPLPHGNMSEIIGITVPKRPRDRQHSI
jgi:hypothetical protein